MPAAQSWRCRVLPHRLGLLHMVPQHGLHRYLAIGRDPVLIRLVPARLVRPGKGNLAQIRAAAGAPLCLVCFCLSVNPLAGRPFPSFAERAHKAHISHIFRQPQCCFSFLFCSTSLSPVAFAVGHISRNAATNARRHLDLLAPTSRPVRPSDLYLLFFRGILHTTRTPALLPRYLIYAATGSCRTAALGLLNLGPSPCLSAIHGTPPAFSVSDTTGFGTAAPKFHRSRPCLSLFFPSPPRLSGGPPVPRSDRLSVTHLAHKTLSRGLIPSHQY
ncbi:hypothetical protein B0J18DRAFT_131218 [Chaetomium sp. MPI-SDFR-AT-0129]|nr:hypothetical protein B0J18DRAFT_131218 [Chaetomium sp. MPI-SDFR-AT-0129]